MRSIYIKYILIISFIGIGLLGKAQKTDSLFHTNGNILLGEIKKMDYGRITFKMDGMGTIMVDVEKVATIKSDKFFQFTTIHGKTVYGVIDSTQIEGVININSGYDSSNIHLYQIVEIFPIKSTFWLRTSGKIALGFNYTKGSNIGRFNLDWSVSYRNKGSLLTLTGSNIQTFSPNDSINTSSKYDFDLELERKLTGIWSWTSNVSGSQNTELGLDLRLKGGVGILGDMIHTNNQRFYGVLGLAPNVEIATQTSNKTINLEGLISLSYQIYNYNFPELYITSKLDLYPSLNIIGRYRVDYTIDANVEVFHNFYIGGTFYYNFDNQPALESAANEDFGFTTTLGYSFN
ncbi:MAG: hypothetical protein ACI85Q_002342 [Salibacteraceae bacterium]|jgi:hypothetical protein